MLNQDSIESISQIPIARSIDSTMNKDLPSQFISPEKEIPPIEDLEIQDDFGTNDPKSQKWPLLFVDVNTGKGKIERVVIFEGDTAESVARNFAIKNELSPELESRLVVMLEKQMIGLLE